MSWYKAIAHIDVRISPFGEIALRNPMEDYVSSAFSWTDEGRVLALSGNKDTVGPRTWVGHLED